MTQMVNISAFDGAATPVAHVFTGISVSRDKMTSIAEYREMLTTVPVEACPRLTIKTSMLKSGVLRTETKVEVPVMEAIAGNNASGYTAAPKVAFVDTDVYVKYSDPRSTIVSRRLSRMLLINVSNNITTSVAAATTGTIPDATDSLVMPT